MFDITKCPIIDGYKRCKTRDGRDVRILCEDVKTNDSITLLALVTYPNGQEVMYKYDAGGRACTLDGCEFDLVNIPIKKTLWVNVHPDGNTYVYGDKQWAEDGTPRNRLVARIKVEYEEGQFDE